MDHPEIIAMQKYGHPSLKDLQNEIAEESRYMEDIYGDEIKIGDEYYINENKDLIHCNNFIEYAEEVLDLEKRER